MAFKVTIKHSAEKELDSLPKELRKRIVRHLVKLEENPHPSGSKKLQGENAYRMRVGDYRILYTIEITSKLITIYAIGHRREVYR